MKIIENNKANDFTKFFEIIDNYRNIQKKWIFQIKAFTPNLVYKY